MADFTNSAAGIQTGFGSGQRFFKADNVITTTATTTDTTSIAPSPGLKSGRFRIRTKSVDASATTQYKLTMGDGGSNSVVVVPTTAATAAGEAIDSLYSFVLDFQATVFTLVITLGGATKTLTYDVECIGCN